jgi:cytochrome c peroxidase
MLAAVACLAFGCREEAHGAPVAQIEPIGALAAASEPIGPLPLLAPERPELVALGAELFAEPLLSEDGQVSCKSCHDPGHGFADELSHSHPAGRPPMPTNTPTLLNVSGLATFNWNGRFSNLEDHLDALIQNPRVQRTTWDAIAVRLSGASPWPEKFARVFAEGPIAGLNVRAALLAYERSLATPGAPFDRWLNGEAGALSPQALEGYELFKSRGCISCHQGALVGGNVFEPLGVMRPFFSDPSQVHEGDLGRFEVTGRQEDRYVFRVPSLRNVALTAPYLHDGSLPRLEMAVSVMATYQLGRSLDGTQITKIVAFLDSLTGPSPKGTP